MSRSLLAYALLATSLTSCAPGTGVVAQQDAGEVDAGQKADAGARCRPACDSMHMCVDGQCVLPDCEANETRCGVICVDLDSSPQHCGTCTKSCHPDSPICMGGSCGSLCDSQFCPNTSTCQMGHCCPAGSDWCTDRCVPTSTDPNNCGGCGALCSAASHGTAACASGQCSIMCDMGFLNCSNTCTSTDVDPHNCGECGHVCTTTGGCAAGHCVRASAACTISASSGWQSCEGLNVVNNEVLIMTASGTWSTGSASSGPEGSGPPGLLDVAYDDMLNMGALLWTVDGTNLDGAFTTGKLTTTATGSGQIQFRINEDLFLGNNSGTMDVTVAAYTPGS